MHVFWAPRILCFSFLIFVTGGISNRESDVEGGCVTGPRPSLLQSGRTACAQKCGKQLRTAEGWPFWIDLDYLGSIFHDFL